MRSFDAVDPVAIGARGDIRVVFFPHKIGAVDALAVGGEDLLVAAGTGHIDLEARVARWAHVMSPMTIGAHRGFAMARRQDPQMDAVERLFILGFMAATTAWIIAQREIAAVAGGQGRMRIGGDARMALDAGELSVHRLGELGTLDKEREFLSAGEGDAHAYGGMAEQALLVLGEGRAAEQHDCQDSETIRHGTESTSQGYLWDGTWRRSRGWVWARLARGILSAPSG